MTTSSSDDPRGDLRWGTIARLVTEAARAHSTTEAVVDGKVRYDYAELGNRVAASARAFVAAGIGHGDRVAMWGPNGHDWIEAALGAVSVGAVLVTLNTRFKASEASYIIRASGARALCLRSSFLGTDYAGMLKDEDLGELSFICDFANGARLGVGSVPVITWDDFIRDGASVDAGLVEARRDGVAPDDLSDLIFTSGTTGHPKGVMMTHAQTLRTFYTWATIVGIERGDRYLVVNPFFHTFGYKAGLLASLMCGATVVCEPVFDLDAIFAHLVEERISVLPGPPTIYQSLLADPRRHDVDLSALRLGVTGAAVVPVELVVAMRDELGFSTVLTAYGLTESCGTVTMCRRGDDPEVISKTAGRAIPDIEVRIVDPDGAEVPRGTPGEIVVRGYNVMVGYFNNEAATAEAIDTDGFLHTGDIGTMDDAGNVTITDRLKDMFVVGGFNAYPAEIEAALRTHPVVDQVAVIGVADERMGEVGCAYIVPAAGFDGERDPQVLFEWCRESMANYKVPRYMVVVSQLPVNASGKVLKRELRDRFAAGTDIALTRG